MTIAGEGRNPGRLDMLKLAEQAGVSSRDANAIIDEVRSAVAHWPECAEEAGVKKAIIREIDRSLPQAD